MCGTEATCNYNIVRDVSHLICVDKTFFRDSSRAGRYDSYTTDTTIQRSCNALLLRRGVREKRILSLAERKPRSSNKSNINGNRRIRVIINLKPNTHPRSTLHPQLPFGNSTSAFPLDFR